MVYQLLNVYERRLGRTAGASAAQLASIGIEIRLQHSTRAVPAPAWPPRSVVDQLLGVCESRLGRSAGAAAAQLASAGIEIRLQRRIRSAPASGRRRLAARY